jgi:hypothetical protein
MKLPKGATKYGNSYRVGMWLVCLDRNPDVPGGRNCMLNVNEISHYYHKSGDSAHTVIVMANGHSFDVDEDVFNISDALLS